MNGQLKARQQRLLEILSEDPDRTVAEISEELAVSEVTVRSDLNRLAAAGQILRTRGGGLPAFHPDILARRKRRAREKSRIAKAAAEMIADGEKLMIVGGTTTAELGQHLLGKSGLQVVTPSPLLFPLARISPSLQLTLVGGEFRPAAESLVGPTTIRQLEAFHVETAFLSADGFTLAKGLTTHLVEVAEVVRTMAAQARRRVLLADSSKYGQVGFARILPLEEIDVLITDDELGDEACAELESIAIEVIRT